MIPFFEDYLQKYSYRDTYIQTMPNENLGIVVVIPCYNEPDVVAAVASMYQCEIPTFFSVEVIVVVNSSELSNPDILEQNILSINQLTIFVQNQQRADIHTYIIHEPALKHKDAGVGLARKIGMDEAVRRFLKINNPQGIVTGYDADCTCSENYFIEIYNYLFHSSLHGCSIHFEHPITNEDSNIVKYETYLRYYKLSFQYTCHPFAYHTIGSSFAVKAEHYCKQGGMNKKKAGEDFYFLQKIIENQNYGELTTTTVYPSGRPSDRVPFGTGAAIQKMIDNQIDSYPTYSFHAFHALREFFIFIIQNEELEEIYKKVHISIRNFLETIDWENKWDEIKGNSSSNKQRIQRFFRWFNAFTVLKYLNFAHSGYFEKEDVFKSTMELLKILHVNSLQLSHSEKFEMLRKIEKENQYHLNFELKKDNY